MSVMTSVIPHGRPFTVDDLEGMPDDGNRYELIDGLLLVTPAPGWSHQEMGFALAVQLRELCPHDLRVLPAPFAVRTAFDSEVQPDVLVARYGDMTMKNLPVAPVLAVEVLSHSTRLKDRNLKTTSASVSRPTGSSTPPNPAPSPPSSSTRAPTGRSRT
jgi:Uma2 family endonuclease